LLDVTVNRLSGHHVARTRVDDRPCSPADCAYADTASLGQPVSGASVKMASSAAARK
jgi:hypothetical protein